MANGRSNREGMPLNLARAEATALELVAHDKPGAQIVVPEFCPLSPVFSPCATFLTNHVIPPNE